MISIHDHPLSIHRTIFAIAAAEKGGAAGLLVADGSDPDYADPRIALMNPRRELPMLVDGDDIVVGYGAVAEYIEERWPDPPMLPSGPAARARSRMIQSVCVKQYEAAIWAMGELLWFRRTPPGVDSNIRRHFANHVGTLQEWLSTMLGDADFFDGAVFGWADAAVAAVTMRSVQLDRPPEPDTAAALERWWERAKDRRSVDWTMNEFNFGALSLESAPHRLNTGEARVFRDHRLEFLLTSGAGEMVQAAWRDGGLRPRWPHDGA